MFVYIFTFTISVILILFSERLFDIPQKKTLGVFLVAIALLVPSIIGGFRDLEIGTDVLAYLTDEFSYALKFNSLQSYLEGSRIEPLYCLLIYTLAHLTGEIHLLLFATQMIIIVVFFIAAYDHRKRAPIWIVFLFFYLFLYQTSFNMFRQSISLAICLYIFKYVERRNFWRFIIGVVIAMGFHITSVLFIILYYLYGKYSSMSFKKLFVFQAILIVLSIFFILFYNEILLGAIYLGVLAPKYIAYTSLGDTFDPFFSYAEFILRLVILFLAIYGYKYKLLNKREASFYLFVVIFELLCTLTSLYSAFASRVSLYFFILNFIYLPQILINSKNKKAFVLFFFAFMLYFWYFMFIEGNVSETFPYSSQILGI